MEDISRWGEEYRAAYEDELRAVCAGLDRMHPRWRETVPYDKLPLEQLTRVKRLHVRWSLITRGLGRHGIAVDYKIDPHGRPIMPFVSSYRPKYREDGTQIFDERHVQILSAPMLADAMSLPLSQVEAAIASYEEAIRTGTYTRPSLDPRRWVAERCKPVKASKAEAA